MDDRYLVGDGSWKMRIFVTDLKVERTLRVSGDLHIGGVMLKLVSELDVTIDWSDHALWWPRSRQWLTSPRVTLDQYGMQADELLHFTPMHKTLRVQLPDLRTLNLSVDFSVKCFSAVTQLCSHLGIRHPEELSLCRPLSAKHLKKNQPQIGVTSRQRSHKPGQWPTESDWSGQRPDNFESQKSITGEINDDLSRSPLADGSGLDRSAGNQEARRNLLRPSTLAERARMNVAWLDSSLSLLAQDVQEHDLLQLRFKFAAIYEPNREQDAVRVHQLFEQARLHLLAGEIECSEAEMYVFAALQLQAGWGSQSGTGPISQQLTSEPSSVDEEIESAIDELRARLEGTTTASRENGLRVGAGLTNGNRSGGLTHVPELSDYLQVTRPKRFTLRTSKNCFCLLKDCRLLCYKNHEERGAQPQMAIRLLGAEVTPEAQPDARKYMIKLEVPEHASSTGSCFGEFWIRFEEQRQYVRWLAAFRLAARGKTMADAVAYEAELRQIDELLALQQPVGRTVGGSSGTTLDPGMMDRLELEDYIAPKFLRKVKSRKQIIQRILDAHANVKHLSRFDAKLKYIRAWQALPGSGVAMFIVRFDHAKKEELLGVAPDRLMRMDPNGDHLETWNFSTMREWEVNWETKQVRVIFDEEIVRFHCLSADSKVVHEFIGGYIFLRMRSKEYNQRWNEDLFHKLTGGW